MGGWVTAIPRQRVAHVRPPRTPLSRSLPISDESLGSDLEGEENKRREVRRARRSPVGAVFIPRLRDRQHPYSALAPLARYTFS